MTAVLYPLLAGALAILFAAIALFFIRFWTRTRDRLFLLFAVAFTLMGMERVVGAGAAAIGLLPPGPGVYLLRLLAFIVIVAAIVDKNLASERQQRRTPTD